MKINKDGEVIVNIYDLYNGLSDEDKKQFLETVTWTDDIFERLSERVLEDYATSKFDSYIFKAREKLLQQAGTLEKEYIKALLIELSSSSKYCDYFRHSLWDLERKIRDWNRELPEEYRLEIPSYNDYPNSDWNIEKFVDQLIEKCK